jgi:hypothetical protein
MSNENLTAIEGLYEHLNRAGELSPGDYTLNATFDASRIAGFSTYRSFDDFYADWLPYRKTFDEWSVEVEELLEGEEERFFVAVRDHGRMKASGGEVQNRVFHVWELRTGKVTAWTVYLDRAEALEAAGLSERAP